MRLLVNLKEKSNDKSFKKIWIEEPSPRIKLTLHVVLLYIIKIIPVAIDSPYGYQIAVAVIVIVLVGRVRVRMSKITSVQHLFLT